MPRPQSTIKTAARGGTAAALLMAAGVLTAISATPAAAQDLGQDLGLRGEVTESAILRDQQARTRELAQAQSIQGNAAAGGLPASIYLPLSQGAAAATDAAGATGSIFADPPAGDAFDGDPVPLPRRRPATAASSAGRPADTQQAATPMAGIPGGESEATDEPPDEQVANPHAATVDAGDRLPLDAGAERTGAIEAPRRAPDTDPFAPPGIRIGTLTLRPSLEQGITATSNATSSHGGRPATLSETTLRLNAASDWSTNSASMDGYLLLRKALSGEEVDEARGRLDTTLNLDLADDWRAIAKLGYEAAPESASSPIAIAGTASQPLRQTFDGSLGIEKDVGKLRLGLTGAVERAAYGDAELSTGGVLSQKDRDSTLATATLRTGYEVSPALLPFVEIEAGRRIYDERLDAGGFERSATRLGARGGVAFDLGEKLAGEFSAGWLRESFDDSRLASIDAATIDADVRWSPQRGTTIGLRGTTELEGSTTAGESGSVLYSGRLSAERQIRANLTGTAALGLDWRDYSGSDGHDLIFSAEAGLTWWFNRYAGLTTRIRHETLSSNLPGRDYRTNSAYLGLTVRR